MLILLIQAQRKVNGAMPRETRDLHNQPEYFSAEGNPTRSVSVTSECLESLPFLHSKIYYPSAGLQRK